MERQGLHSAVKEAEFLVRQAQNKAMAGDHTSAENYLKKAIDSYPRYAEAYTLLGNCKDCQGKSEDAIASYDMALQIVSHARWFNKGMSLKNSGSLKNQCVEKSIDLYCGR
jgi:Flp pilus assembly protein TadD